MNAKTLKLAPHVSETKQQLNHGGAIPAPPITKEKGGGLLEEHLNNEKTSWFVVFEIIFFFTCNLILPILLAIYYNIGESAGGAIIMALIGILLDFVALMIAALLIDDRNGQQSKVRFAAKNFVVDLLFNILFCCVIVTAKHFAIKTGVVVVGMIVAIVIFMVVGVFLITPEQGSERG